MKQPVIEKSTLAFLKNLDKNNNREWFNAHKDSYTSAHENMIGFTDALIGEISKHDDIENESGRKSLLRIYSDTRFHKDKLPYTPRFAASLQRATKLRRGGYFLHIRPGGSRLGVGFFGPSPDDLKRIREDISANHEQWQKLLKSKGIKGTFGAMQGDQVATAPRGFSVDDPAIELLRYKQFVFRRSFTDEEVLSANFLKMVNDSFKAIRPWLNHMSEVLTTDMNGESIL